MRKTLLAMTIAAFTMGSTAVVAAPQQAQMQQGQQEAQAISDDMLEKFVVAMEDVREVSDKYAEEFQNAEDADQAQEIQQKAQEEMVSAVSDSGLSPEEYNTIVQRVQQDEALRERLEELSE